MVIVWRERSGDGDGASGAGRGELGWAGGKKVWCTVTQWKRRRRRRVCHYLVSSPSLTPSTSGLLIARINLIRVCRQIS